MNHPLHDMPNDGKTITVQDHLHRKVELHFVRGLSYVRVRFIEGESTRHLDMKQDTFIRLALWFLWRWAIYDWCGLRTRWRIRRYLKKVK